MLTKDWSRYACRGFVTFLKQGHAILGALVTALLSQWSAQSQAILGYSVVQRWSWIGQVTEIWNKSSETIEARRERKDTMEVTRISHDNCPHGQADCQTHTLICVGLASWKEYFSKRLIIRNSGSNVENVNDLDSCVAFSAQKLPSFSMKLTSESSRGLKYSSCNLAKTSTSLCTRPTETSLYIMVFLIKAQASKSPCRFSYINFNVGSETLYGYMISPNCSFWCILSFFFLCFNAMISKNQIHRDYSWEWHLSFIISHCPNIFTTNPWN